jgi:hypothetical protein
MREPLTLGEKDMRIRESLAQSETAAPPPRRGAMTSGLKTPIAAMLCACAIGTCQAQDSDDAFCPAQ